MGGGGGGTTQTSTSGIDKEFKPQLKEGLDISLNRLRSQVRGEQPIVAGLTGEQQASLGAQTKLAEDAISGRGMYDLRKGQEADLKNLMGTSLGAASGAGSLGSARSQKAMMSALGDLSNKQQLQRIDLAEKGVKSLGDVGSTRQEQGQRELDAMSTALNQFFGRLQGAPKTTETTSSGGGK